MSEHDTMIDSLNPEMLKALAKKQQEDISRLTGVVAQLQRFKWNDTEMARLQERVDELENAIRDLGSAYRKKYGRVGGGIKRGAPFLEAMERLWAGAFPLRPASQTGESS